MTEQTGIIGLSRFQKGKQAIGIFELSNLFDITTEALRKYEAKHLLQPYREENGYRKYSSWDLTKIIYIRQLRQEGFSLNDIISELGRNEPLRQIENLATLRQTLLDEISHRQRLVQWIDSRKQEISQAEKLGDDCAVERQKRQYCCVYMVGNTLVDKKGSDWEHLKEWMQALPFARVSHITITSADDTVSCLTLEADELEQYGLQHLIPDFILPEQTCIICNTSAQHSQNMDTSTQSIEQPKEKVLKLGLPLTGASSFQMLWFSQQDGVFYSHNKAIFPIAE